MRKEIKKDSEEWKAFREVWDFYQNYAIPEENEKYWEDVVRIMGEIERKYKTPLGKWLSYGVAKALNEIAKGGK